MSHIAGARWCRYKPSALRIQKTVLKINRDAESEEEVPVALTSLLEMIAGGGLTKIESATNAAQDILRVVGELPALEV